MSKEINEDKFTATIEINDGKYQVCGLRNGMHDSHYRPTTSKDEVLDFVQQILSGA